MNIKPLSDNVLILPDAQEESKLFIPESAKLKPEWGKVIAVGPGQILGDGSYRPMSVKPGDYVMFNTNYSHKKVREYLLMPERDILVVEDNTGVDICNP